MITIPFRTPPHEKIALNIINCHLELLPLHKKQLLSLFPKTPVLHTHEVHPDVLYAEQRLFEIQVCPDNIPLISSFTSLLLSQIFPCLHLADYKDQIPQDISCDIIAYIASHFNEDISLTSVANEFGIGKYKLSRIFSNILGLNFSAYINSLRINYAKYLLSHTDWTVLKIAIECGYHNQQTFNRVFREHCFCTPKDYRNLPCKDSFFPYI